MDRLKEERESLKERLEGIKDQESDETESLKKRLEKVEADISRVDKAELGASLDSEIALALRQEYPLAGWVPNPLFVGHQGRFVEGMPEKGEVLHGLPTGRPGSGDRSKDHRRQHRNGEEADSKALPILMRVGRSPRMEDGRKRQDRLWHAMTDPSIWQPSEFRKSGRMKVVRQ